MKIGKPFKEFKNAYYPEGSVTQWFGENPQLYGKICPVVNQCLKGHNGIDMVAPWGTPLYAVEDMRITEAKDAPEGYGLYVRGTNSKHEWTYGHLSKIAVEAGQIVKQGDYIGDMGNTGFVVSSQNANGFWKYNPYLGTHLHLGVRDLNERGRVINYDNGYFGCYDFKDYLPDIDPVNDDINGFVSQLKVLLVKLQQAGIPLNLPINK
jgi:murein DD-endopeptidase MepM/ murein hydrolase activator NlpD